MQSNIYKQLLYRLIQLQENYDITYITIHSHLSGHLGPFYDPQFKKQECIDIDCISSNFLILVIFL